MSTRAEALAARVEQGTQALASFAEGLSNNEWQTICDDGRPAGVLVHHVASQLIGETDVMKQMAAGEAFTGVNWAMVDEGNATHAKTHASCSQQEAAELLRRNGALAAEAIRALRDEQLDMVTPNSLHADAPVTTQFWIENHPLAHAYRHLASIRAALSAL
jgi:DinB family protein